MRLLQYRSRIRAFIIIITIVIIFNNIFLFTFDTTPTPQTYQRTDGTTMAAVELSQFLVRRANINNNINLCAVLDPRIHDSYGILAGGLF